MVSDASIMSLSKQTLEHLRGRQALLDSVIAEAGRDYLRRTWRQPSTRFDLEVTNEELFKLSRNGDFCYDRPSAGVLYALWYHGRRVNTSLALVLSLARSARGEPVTVLDLGAGTGAVQWALAVACDVLLAEGQRPPHFKVISVDTSPFMLSYLIHQWGYLGKKFPACAYINYQTQLNTWQVNDTQAENLWLFASYLFDYEDKRASLAKDFVRLVELLRPEHVVLSSSRQPQKLTLMNAVSERLQNIDFVARTDIDLPPFDLDLEAVNQLRSDLRKAISSINGMASWKEHSFHGRIFTYRQPDLGFASPSSAGIVGKESLFAQRVTDRREVELSAEQDKAARPDGRPTLIHGPAGCGKSIVITERIVRLIEQHGYDPQLRILVTSFNKTLLQEVIHGWLLDLLDARRVKWHPRSTSCRAAMFGRSSMPNLYLMHFDVMPTQLGLVDLLPQHANVIFGKQQLRLAELALQQSSEELQKHGFVASDFNRIRDPAFLLDEYHQVYYGQFQSTEHRFMTRGRPGRPRFDRDGRPRRALWKALERFQELLAKGEGRGPFTTFIARRNQFYEILGSGGNASSNVHSREAVYPKEGNGHYRTVAGLAPWQYANFFTHIFVDEMQDCTLKDYALFYQLISDPNELVVAGDLVTRKTQCSANGISNHSASQMAHMHGLCHIWRREIHNHRFGGR